MASIERNAGPCGLLLSGGLDSVVLLGQLLESGRCVQPFYVRSRMVWEDAELAALGTVLNVLASPALRPLVALDMPVADLYGQHWSLDGHDTPDAASPDEAVYLPGRNALLCIKPALWCAMHGIEELALAVLGSSPFPDATDAFFHDFGAALDRATGCHVTMTRPFGHLEKSEVMRLGRRDLLAHSFSCIAPFGRQHCGRCNKCAERQRAFASIGLNDPTPYAKEAALEKS